MLLILYLVVLLLLVLRSRWQRRNLYKLANQLKGSYRGLPFIGHSYLLAGGEERRMKGVQLIGRDTIKHGGIIAFWHMSELLLFVADPVVAESVLKSCVEKADVVRIMREITGNGSIFAPVPIWRPRRKIVAPTFRHQKVIKFMDTFIRQSSIMVENVRKEIGKGTFSIWNILTAYTMNSVCESTLGVKLEYQKSKCHPFLKSMDVLHSLTAMRMCQPWLHSDLVFKRTPYWTKFRKARVAAYAFIDKIIKEKRRDGHESSGYVEDLGNTSGNRLKTFLEVFMQTSENNVGLTDEELLEEALVVVSAATQTSALSIGFTLLLLGNHPDIQEKIYQELKEVFGDSDRKIDPRDFSKLVYLDAVINEALRLYPPIPLIARKVEKDTLLPTGVKVVEGCNMLINIWAMHRNPQYWGDDAEEYRPERFIDSQLKHPAAFLPFSIGSRGCLGNQYAMISVKTALSALLRQYRVLPPSGSEPGSYKLRTKYNVLMSHVDEYELQLECRT